jgi:PAS domain S-box-containing protein
MNMKTNSSSTLDYFRKRAEFLLKQDNNSITTPLNESEVLGLIHQLQVQQIELQLQNDDLRHGWAKAEIASEKFEALYNNAPTGYITLSKEGIINEINPCGSQLLGREKSKLKNARFAYFIADDSKAVFNLFLETLFSGSNRESCDLTILAADRSIKYINVTGIVPKKSEHCILTLVDLTDKLQRERDLRESEEKYRRFFERASYGIFQSTPDGKAISVNPAFAAMFGYNSMADAISGIRDVSKDIFADPGRRYEIIGLMQGNPDLNSFENIYKRKDGSFFTGLLTVIPVYDEVGKIKQLEGFIEDITARKQAQEALKESEVKYRGLVENSPDAIVIYVDGSIVFANLESHRLMGATAPDQLKGMSVMQFVHPDSRSLVVRRMEKLAKERSVLPLTEEKFIKFDGSEVQVEVKAVPISFENKPAVQLIIRDISGRKIAETQLQMLNKSLKNIFQSEK